MMNNIVLNKTQTKTIAQEIYGDVKSYCLDNFERYFIWYLNDIRKSKGKPPLKLEPTTTKCNPGDCDYCFYRNFTNDDIDVKENDYNAKSSI